MVAEVELVMRVMEERRTGGDSDLVTRDFLGGCSLADAKKDAASELGGHDFLSMPPDRIHSRKKPRPLQDLNLFPSPATAAPVTAKAASPEAAAPYASIYQSVCTIEKVKSALDRLQREQSQSSKQSCMSTTTTMAPQPDGVSPSSSITSSSTKRKGDNNRSSLVDDGEQVDDDCNSPAAAGGGGTAGGLLATACSHCLMYVLISMDDPKCPRCSSHVHPPLLRKKRPRIDLNDGELLGV